MAVALLAGAFVQPALAQSQAIIQQGDAVVTGFSGVTQWRNPDDEEPVEYQVIDLQGISLQVFDLSLMYGADDDARLVPAEQRFAVSAGQTGQVFGVALDDGIDAEGEKRAPNIYTSATSAFGLQLLKETETQINRTKAGGPGVKWMDGQFGAPSEGGPGSIWKIDGATGEVTLFANVTHNDLANTGPALGNITFDRIGRRLYVSDMQTGMIHAFDLDGNELDKFDHGKDGRAGQNLTPVAYDKSVRREISDLAFKSDDPQTWGFAPPERRVWGLAVQGRRLFYSVAAGPDIWSVGIGDDDAFANAARLEVSVEVPGAPSGDPVSDIAFGADGSMYLAQRGQTVSSYDYTELARQETAAVLRYTGAARADGSIAWAAEAGEYPVGFAADNRNTNGGVALGYGYYPDGYIRYDACQQRVWSTGGRLRQNPEHSARLGEKTLVDGLQGSHRRSVKPANTPPFQSYQIDIDDEFENDNSRGHMGDVAIWSECTGSQAGGGVVAGGAGGSVSGGNAGGGSVSGGSAGGGSVSGGTAGGGSVSGGSAGGGSLSGGTVSGGPGGNSGGGFPPGLGPRIPGQANVRITNKCSAASFGGTMTCRVTLVNVGAAAPVSPVGFTNTANSVYALSGTSGPTLVSARFDQRLWTCSRLPARLLTCTIPGQILRPGQPFFVDVVIDISGVSGRPGWKVSSSATLSTNGTTVTVRVGGGDFVVTKTAPGTCRADDHCTFNVSVTNNGSSVFRGNLQFSDDMTISPSGSAGVTVSGVWPRKGCTVRSGSQFPLQWQCRLKLRPKGGVKTFQVQVFIPKSAGPASGTSDARSCVVATSLAGSGGAQPATPVATLVAGAPARGPGSDCVDFKVSAANKISSGGPKNFKPTLPPWPQPPGAKCKGLVKIKTSLSPKMVSAPGVPVTFQYTVKNTTNCEIYEFRITEFLNPPGALDPGPYDVECPVKTRNNNPLNIRYGNWGDWWGPLQVKDEVVCESVYLTKATTRNVATRVELDAKW